MPTLVPRMVRDDSASQDLCVPLSDQIFYRETFQLEPLSTHKRVRLSEKLSLRPLDSRKALTDPTSQLEAL